MLPFLSEVLPKNSRMKLKLLSSLALALPLAMFGQVSLDTAYQVNYASNLNIGDAVINVSNSGFSAGGNQPIVNANTYGDICANIYVYAPDQEQATCCTCLVSPNSLHSFAVSYGPGNLLTNVPGGGALASIRATNSVVIKLLATAAAGAGATLNDSCPRPDAPLGLVTGLVSWATHAHPTNTTQAAITETPSTPSTLSTGEFLKLTQDCNYNLTRGSQVQCPGCRVGGLATGL
ncbi:MAG: hypothetical protein JO150_02860 [Acidobacteriaceae bacterium]|nr:hypothetical protein [Acidobacteriaceae bacterium]